MPALKVHVKHAGKTYDVQLDPDLPPAVFKEAVYQVTGVPPGRMKVMVKGGFLKVCVTPLAGVVYCISRFRMILHGRKLGPKRSVFCLILHCCWFMLCGKGQSFTVIGAAGDLPKPPEKPIVFLEGEFFYLQIYIVIIVIYRYGRFTIG